VGRLTRCANLHAFLRPNRVFLVNEKLPDSTDGGNLTQKQLPLSSTRNERIRNHLDSRLIGGRYDWLCHPAVPQLSHGVPILKPKNIELTAYARFANFAQRD
jgi:hypothetical protein